MGQLFCNQNFIKQKYPIKQKKLATKNSNLNFYVSQIFYEMAKRYFKSVKSVQKANWSRENTSIFVQSTNQTFGTNIIPATTVQGIRTVGNFTITLTGGTDTSNPIYWALVYAPQGQTTANLTVTDGQPLYEPNQYVIACGVNDPTAGPIRINSRMKRKLNSGDFVSLLMFTGQDNGPVYRGVVSYSVKYN